jgi:CHAT domain-containing protein
MHRLPLVLVALLSVPAGRAAAPPARLTRELVAPWTERNRWIEQAGKEIQAGRLDEAIDAISRAFAVERRVVGGQLSSLSLDTLTSQALLLERRERWREAEVVRREVLAAQTRLRGAQDWRTIDARLRLEDSRRLEAMTPAQRRRLYEAEHLDARAHQLWREGRPKEGAALAEKSLAARRELLGDEHHLTAQSLHILGSQYQRLQQWAEAFRAYRQALAISAKVQGKSHPEYAVTANNLAALYKATGDLRAALRLYAEARDVYRAALGETHPRYASSLHNLAAAHHAAGDHRDALALLEEALAIRKREVGEDHPSYASSLAGLAVIHTDMGDHRTALPLARQALAIARRAGEKHPSYAIALKTLAMLYRDMGDYRAALPLARQALEVTRRTAGERHSDFATHLNNLARIHHAMGDYQVARTFYGQVLDLRKQLLGEGHPAYADSLNNLAMLYQDMGDRKSALPLARQAVAIRKRTVGERHPDYATGLNNLATLYEGLGDFETALTLHRQALAATRFAVGAKHPDYATSLNNLAWLHRRAGRFKEALPLARQSLAITRQALGETHPLTSGRLNNLALLHLALGEPNQARALSEQALALTRRHLDFTASVQSERQQLAAAEAARHQLNLRLSLGGSGDAGACLNHVLAWKGAVFAAQRQRRLFARLTGGQQPRVSALARELEQVTRRLAVLPHLSFNARLAGERRGEAGRLTARKEALEGALATLAADFRAAHRPPDAMAVRESLPEDVALIDFFFYPRQDPARRDLAARNVDRLTAFVVRRGRPVERLDLGPAAAVLAGVQGWREALGRNPDGLSRAGEMLRRVLWLPLRKHLAGARLVRVSPDGALGRLPLAALPGGQRGTYLLEEVALATLPVPQLLPALLGPAAPAGKPNLLAVGNVEFGLAGRTRAAGPRWAALPATRLEVAAVQGAFRANFRDGASTVLAGSRASKAAVSAALPGHRYAHLATHGFFAAGVPSAASEREARLPDHGETGRWHPGLLSGIVLAGASSPAEGEDGILTALEVAEMDLSSLELTVLSACETGLGKEAAGEGLLGLQRAFQVAGCRSVVSSLWSVEDAATSVLMERFYRHLWGQEKVSRLEALHRAQLDLLRQPELIRKRARKLREELARRGEEKLLRGLGKVMVRLPTGGGKAHPRADPLYWAAFVLSGDWR